MADATAAALTSDDNNDNNCPIVVLLVPTLPEFYNALVRRFKILKPWESQLPLDQFLAIHSSSIRVLLCSGPFPKIDTAVLDQLPNLELVVGSSAGIDHIDFNACSRRGVAVTNAGDAFSDETADYAVGLLIDVLRQVSAADRYVRKGLWPVNGDFPLGSKLGGKKVGIVGFGSIGSRVAKRLESFGCIIMYNSKSPKTFVSYPYFSNARDLAAASDVLILTCSLTSETRHMINRDVLLALGEKGVIINVARGAIIDEKELVSCLMQEELGGAGFDVYENEPNVPKELFQMDNVVLSPHRAVLTPESFNSLLQIIIGNLEAFFSNRPLLTPVSA